MTIFITLVQSIFLMWTFSIILLSTVCTFASTSTATAGESEEPELYYYGLEESERSLPACGVRQACSALVRREWRAPALVRLCRCARRSRCDTPAPAHSRIPINNRDYFQFCRSTTDWPICSFRETPLSVETKYDRINPDELEELHHQNTQLIPPKVTFKCKCPEPNYWKLNSTAESETTQVYQCTSLPPCKTGEFCGNVNYDLNALYQSCLCPKHHICVHNGGITHRHISELLYRGRGWRACCQPTEEFSYEDYYE